MIEMKGILTAVRVNGFAEGSMEYLLDLFHIKTYGYKPYPTFDNRPISHSDTYLLNELNKILATEGLIGRLTSNFIVKIEALKN